MTGEEDPVSLARKHARPVRPKRFYEFVTLADTAKGIEIHLDGRPLRTPARAPLRVAVVPIAEAIVAEWQAQLETIDPSSMPVTRISNSAIDAVAPDVEAARLEIVAYAGDDLLCYRAEGPAGLVQRQALGWDPLLSWAATELGARLAVREGILPLKQPPESIAGFAAALEMLDPLALAALHVATTLTGSAILAMSVARGLSTADAAWQAAHIDEDWQAEQWGADPEAIARREQKWRDMNAASFILTNSPGMAGS